MDARFWLTVIAMWPSASIVTAISFMRVPRFARQRFWRVARVIQPVSVILLAVTVTLTSLDAGHHPVFGLSQVGASILGIVPCGLALVGVVFRACLSLVQAREL